MQAFINWLIRPLAIMIARRVNFAIDAAVNETGIGVTTSELYNALEIKAAGLLNEAQALHDEGADVQDKAQNWYANTVAGAERHLNSEMQRSQGIHEKAARIETNVNRIRTIGRNLRDGQ